MRTNREIWRDIPTWEGYYTVSNYGRVKTTKRVIFRSNGWKHTIAEKIRVGRSTNKGYLIARLKDGDRKKNYFVHQLVAMAFLNHKPDETKLVVDHIDHNKKNNNKSNLQVISNRENSSKDKWRYDTESKYVGVRLGRFGSRWRAAIDINGKQKYLGRFDTEEEASKAYQDALTCVQENRIYDIVRKKPNFHSDYKGISWHKRDKKWTSSVRIDGKRKYLGCFKTELQAYEAQQKTQIA